MFSKSFKPVRAGMPVTRQVRELQRAVSASRNHRPGTGYRAVATPFGTAVMSAATDWFTAFTTAEIPAATIDSNNVTTVGKNDVYMTFPNFDDTNGTLTFVPDTTRTIPVYNLSLQSVTGSTNVIIGRVWGILIVLWESCPAPT